jgi:hypothetical protein
MSVVWKRLRTGFKAGFLYLLFHNDLTFLDMCISTVLCAMEFLYRYNWQLIDLTLSVRMCVHNTGWSKSHGTHVKIFIGGCNSTQFDWINKHTLSLWLYKSLHRSRHVVTCSLRSVSRLSKVEVQGCLFNKCNECSLSNTTWHLVLTKLARRSLRIFSDSPVPNK